MLKDTYRVRNICFPSADKLPPNFSFPQAYLEYINHDVMTEIYPWVFMCHFKNTWLFDGWLDIVKKQYPDRQLVPFAKRESTDDIACFEPSDNPALPGIYFIHTFTKPGYEERGHCATFEEWLEVVTEEAEDFQTEDPDYAEDFDD